MPREQYYMLAAALEERVNTMLLGVQTCLGINPLSVDCTALGVTRELPPAVHSIAPAALVALQGEELLHHSFPRVQTLASS